MLSGQSRTLVFEYPTWNSNVERILTTEHTYIVLTMKVTKIESNKWYSFYGLSVTFQASCSEQ